MASIGSSSAGLTFDSIVSSFSTAYDNSTTSLNTAIANMQTNQDPTALLQMQMAMQKWSMLIELQGTLSKTLSDTMKGIIQKAS